MNIHTKVKLDKLKLLKALINLFSWALLLIIVSILAVNKSLFLVAPFTGFILFFMAVARIRLLNLEESILQESSDDKEEES